MQTTPNSAAGNLIQQLFLTVEAVGIDKTDEILKKAQYQVIEFDNKNVEVVVTTVAKKFKMPIHEIIYGNGRKNERKLAIGFCCFYLHEIFHYDMMEVAEYLKKDITLCWKYAKLVPKLSPKHPTDKEYLDHKAFFDEKFTSK